MIYPSPGDKRRRGFTLLELLIVLLIVSLLVGLVPPLFSSAVPGARLKAAVRDLAVALRLARNQAITHDLETQVYINLEAPAYTVGSRAPHPLPAGVQLQVDTGSGQAAAQAGHHVIRFFSDGSSSGAVITLRSGERGYRLHLGWLTGRITIEDAQTDGR